MATVRLLILAALIATAACTIRRRHEHHPHRHPHRQNHHLPQRQPKSSHTIKNCLSLIFNKWKPSPKVCSQDALQFLQKCKKPKHISDVIKTLINLVQGFGGVMDTPYPGLGSLATRMVIALTRLGVCKHGGHRFTKRPSFCTRDFPQFGLKGEGRDVNDVCKRFRVNDAVNQVQEFIDKHTDGEGIQSVKGKVRGFFQFCINLAKLLDNRSGLSDKVFSKVIVQVSIAIGVFINDHEYGLGPRVSIGIIKTFHPFVVEYGFPGILDRCDEVKKTIVECNEEPAESSDGDKTEDVQDNGDDWCIWEDEQDQDIQQSTDEETEQATDQETEQGTDQDNCQRCT